MGHSGNEGCSPVVTNDPLTVWDEPPVGGPVGAHEAAGMPFHSPCRLVRVMKVDCKRLLITGLGRSRQGTLTTLRSTDETSRAIRLDLPLARVAPEGRRQRVASHQARRMSRGPSYLGNDDRLRR
jgi:hypothetical protein